jgi:hypothetical protein
MTIETLMWLLPVFFILHDFEEIIMFKPWISRNSDELFKRFPKLAARFLPHMEKLSTSSFAVAVVEIFLILSIMAFVAVELKLYSLWTGILLAFFVHLILHIIQFAAYRKYVPVIITSFVCCLYCIGALFYLIGANLVNWPETAIWTIVVVIVAGIDIILAHRLAERFERYLKKRN